MQEKLINRTVKDSGEINEAFDALIHILLLLHCIVKEYYPYACLQFAHYNNKEHLEIINSKYNEQIDMQLQQQDLDDYALRMPPSNK